MDQQTYNTIFSLHQQFESLNERLILENSVQVDSLNTIYVATQTRIYVIRLKRLIANQDWIQDIIHLKDILGLKDNKMKYQPNSTDPITSAFNQEKKDRVSQIDFLKFAVTEQGIPMIHSSLISQRLRGLNNDPDLLGFRSMRIHPLEPGVLAFVLNNGDAYIYKKGENLISINKLLVDLFLKSNKKFKHITSVCFSETILLDKPLTQSQVILAVTAGTYLYLIILPQMIALEKIELYAENVHEQLIIRVEQSLSGTITLQCLALVCSGKVYSICLKLNPEDLSSLSHDVKSLDVVGCLSIHWRISDHIVLQEGMNLFDFSPSLNVKNSFPIDILPSFSKIVKVFPKQRLFIMQNGEGLFHDDSQMIHDDSQMISILRQLYSVSGAAQSNSTQILILGGQPDVTQQKKGTFVLLAQKSSSLTILGNILRSVKERVKLVNGNIVIPLRAINLDDIVLLERDGLVDQKGILGSCLALHDEKYFNLVDPEARKLHLNEARDLKKIFEGDRPEVQEYCTSVVLLQIMLLGKKQLQGWEQIYLRCYRRFLENIEENVKVALLSKVKLPKFLTQRLEMIHSGIFDQLYFTSAQIKGNQEEYKVPNQNQFKFFNSASLRTQVDALNKQDWAQNGKFQSFKCPICVVNIEGKDQNMCINQHRFLRCDLTLEPLHEQKIIKCRICKFQYGEVEGLPLQIFFMQKFVCPVCCGECKYL